MEQAALIYRAPDAAVARQLMGEWSEKWRPQAPEAVATLERDVEQTLVFYQLDAVAQEWIRTTSLLERTNRELRRKCAASGHLWQCSGCQCCGVFASSTASCLLDQSQLVGRFSCFVFFPRGSLPLERDTLSH